ncbi:MAG: ParB/RepB/Spo0J family partition protein [Clostridia bacterium]|nr:ParB/RepB/Spo0J family partition protein [Clostridia bacterium]MBR5619294.1 ParB/RepB/Spo0J family partition protein [Clostridia bacterium]
MKVTNILINKIHPFEGHPYKVLDNAEMDNLTASVHDYGVREPVLVRPHETIPGEFEMIAGHRRMRAAQKAGLTEIPAVVCEMTRDEAAVMVVDSNLHREHILPSEKAFAYRLKMEALSRQGKRTDLTSGQVVPKSGENRTGDLIGADFGESYKTVQRYIRLTYLIPELLDLMDEGKIAFMVGVELSYLPDDLQYVLLGLIEELDCTPSYAQANHMHKEFAAGTLTEGRISEMMSAEKPNQKEKVSIPLEKLSGYFRQGTTPQDIQTYILKLLEEDRQRKRRARSRDAR